ncbi:MAG: hypothetical protein WCI73_20065, partial [Phycisphaerae bacterium]
VPVVAMDSPAVRFILEQCTSAGEMQGIMGVAESGSKPTLVDKIQEVMENIDGKWGGKMQAQEMRRACAAYFAESTMITRYAKYLKFFLSSDRSFSPQ